MQVYAENKRSFLDLFPAPDFLGMPSPALAVSDSTVRFISFEKTKEGLVVDKYSSEFLPEGVVSSGNIEDSKTLVDILKRFRKANDLKYIRSILPEEKGYIFVAKLPQEARKDLRTAVEFIIEENVPVSLSEVVFDYDVLSRGEDGGDIWVSVSVVPEVAVNSYLEAYHGAGLSPLHFEMESQALARALVPRDSDQPTLLVHLGRSKIGFCIVDRGAVNFTSTLSIAHAGPFSIKDLEGKGKIDPLSLYPAASLIQSEMSKVFLYWETQKDRWGSIIKDIDRIIVGGIYADIPGVRKFANYRNISAEIGNVWVNAFSLDSYIPPIPRSDALGYAGVVGISLPRN